MTPAFLVTIAGDVQFNGPSSRLLSVSVSDSAGNDADQIELALDDRKGGAPIPEPGALITVVMGYAGGALVDMGQFTADGITVKSPAQTVTIRGKAADLGGTIKEQKSRSWHNKTVGQIVAQIAGEHELDHRTGKELRSIVIEHRDQTDESDLNFLMRMAREHDALVTVKSRTLLYIKRGEGRTASGAPIAPVVVGGGDTMNWSMTRAMRDEFKTVEAKWRNGANAQIETVTAGEGSPVKKLRHTHATQGEAQQAADAKLRQIKRGKRSLSADLVGTPMIAAECPMDAVGFRVGVDGRWLIKSARHTIDNSGYKTTITAEEPSAQ